MHASASSHNGHNDNRQHEPRTEQSPLGRFEQRLWEAYQGLWDNIVDPREAFDDDDGRWRLLGDLSDRSCGAVPFATEAELRQIRAECRTLAVTNEFAINGHENRISYVVGAGHTYRVVARQGVEASPELLIEAQAALDEFFADNAWQRRQQEIVHRRDRDGEVFLRLFVSPQGRARVRFVEPSQISTPPTESGNPSASFGVLTDPQDVEETLGYFVDGQLIDAAEIQHRKANVDSNVKRGLPLFYPVRKNLRRAEKLLRNMSTVAEIQSAIALIRRHQGATRSAVQQFVAGQADATTTAGGRTTNWKQFAPGTILDTSANVEYQFPAQGLDAGSYVTVLQAELRAIAARLVMPEFMLSSDASNSNYASTMVAETPAVRMFERLQAEQMEADRQLLDRVLLCAERAGRLPAGSASNIEVHATAPSLAVRDAKTDADVAEIEFRNGVLSPQTWSAQLGLDYTREQEYIAAYRAAQVAKT
ncbi:MAG TPA: phage portal protein [Pirellulales bacterium]|jgi:hypothetical protein